jgi:hypothetical protein
MTQGVIETKDSAVKVGVYDAKPAIARDTNIDTKPTDLIRWGPSSAACSPPSPH